MRTLLNNHTMFKNDNVVAISDCWESMCNNKSCWALAHLINCLLYLSLSLCIQSWCSLIKTHNRSLFEQSSSNSDSLLFTSRKLKTSFSDTFPVASLLFHYEIMNWSSFWSWYYSFNKLLTLFRIIYHLLDVFFSDSSISDIIHNCIVE